MQTNKSETNPNCESKWSVLILEEEGNYGAKPCIIDTGEHYYELDEEGKLYRNGVLVTTHVKSIFRVGQSANCLSFSTPPSWVDTILGKTCNNDNWLMELVKEDTDHDRDYLNRWTTEPALPIKVGESVVGMAYFDNGKDQDYSVTITDPDFLKRVTAVQEKDGRMRTRGSDHLSKRADDKFGRQFIGQNRIGDTPHYPRTLHQAMITHKPIDEDNLPKRGDIADMPATAIDGSKSYVDLDRSKETSKDGYIPPNPRPITKPSKEEIDTYQSDFYIRPRNKGENDGD